MVKSSAPLRDLSSLGNPHEVSLKHLDWRVDVDFEYTIFRSVATYTIEKIDVTASILQLDTSHLVIQSVRDADDGSILKHKIYPNEKPHLGSLLVIHLKNGCTRIAITYCTTEASSAIQWLPPAQTAGKKHPYLFTQCQAIHARSMLPCHDQPGAKMTFDAHVHVPSWAVCVMSGLLENKVETMSSATYHWKQAVPIPSYLIAMAVGHLSKRDISERCAVWSEPTLVEPAVYEFAQAEEFLKIAEDLAGTPYAWGRYDLLCLPPSFPYGGMENPCLTFVTPTLLAQDRSLADVVAHEIAHSWTGNLVTNATWDHFWLNEGWTTWFQRKIMARIHNDDRFLDFDAIGGYKTLQETMKEVPPKFQSLVLCIGADDPDDSYSSVAYEKGFNLLYYLEKLVGKAAFESFFQAYIEAFASKTLSTEDFKAFFLDHFQGNSAIADVDWDTWLYKPGMPPVKPSFDRSLSEASEQLAKDWLAVDRDSSPAPATYIKGWSTSQITSFLDYLQTETASTPLKRSTLKVMDEKYNFSQSQNAEIIFRFCKISIASEDETMLMVIVYFITTQGRMKYVRPLYRALHQSKMGKDLAVDAFLKNKDFYHPICAKMIASDLKVGLKPPVEEKLLSEKTDVWKWAAVAGALCVVVGVVLRRRRR